MAIMQFHEILYIESILSICQMAQSSIENAKINMTNILKSNSIDDQKIDTALNDLQNIIVQSANLSKFFWPDSKKKELAERGNILRNAFLITDDNVLKNKEVRNAIEHYDERLDDFCGKFIGGIMKPKYIGNSNFENYEISILFKAYLVDKDAFVILGEHIILDPIVKEIQRCFIIAKELRIKGGISWNWGIKS